MAKRADNPGAGPAEASAVSERAKEFKKYLAAGAYHWDATVASPFTHVAFTAGRYDVILRQPVTWQGSRVLDVACGDARLTAYVAAAGARSVVGLDLSLLGLTCGRRRWQREQKDRSASIKAFVRADGLKLPVAAGSFDVVIASEIIEHLEDPRSLIEEAAQAVRPSGALIVSTPVRLTDQPLDPFHVREYFPSDLEPLMQEYFSSVEVTLSHPAWVTSLYTLRGLAWPFRVLVNVLSILGRNPFLTWPMARYAAQMTLLAREPKARQESPKAGGSGAGRAGGS